MMKIAFLDAKHTKISNHIKREKYYKIIFLCLVLKYDRGRVNSKVTQISTATIGKFNDMKSPV